MSDDALYCQDLVRARDRDRYIATLFAPVAARPALFALYAFDIEVAHVRNAVREPMAGEIRLQWWRDVLDGQRGEETAAHPVASALKAAVVAHDLDVSPLQTLIDERGRELYGEPIPHLVEFDIMARETSSPIFLLGAQCLGVRGVKPIADAAGSAYGATRLLREFARDVSQGRVLMPQDVLARHEVSYDDMVAGRVSPGLSAALAEMRQHAAAAYGAFVRAAQVLDPAALPAFLPLALVPSTLAGLEANEKAPFAPVELAPWRAPWIMWRTARRGFR